MKPEEAAKQVALDRELLKVLQARNLPATKGELEDDLGLKLSPTTFKGLIKGLIGQGYDIKTIEKKDVKSYVLVRTGLMEPGAYYRILGKAKTPLILTGDWHIGSKGWTEQGYEELKKDTKKFRIKHLLHAGDLVQGLGVYRTELMDILNPDIDGQVDAACDYLKDLDCEKHIIIGNHETVIKGKHRVGFDAVRNIAVRIPDCTYYGSVANLEIDSKYSLLMMHGSGGRPYADSYPLQKIWRELIERPDVFVMGHFHLMIMLLKPPHHRLFIAGTLQRESAWLLQKGITAQVGWWIIKSLDPTGAEVIPRRPKVF